MTEGISGNAFAVFVFKSFNKDAGVAESRTEGVSVAEVEKLASDCGGVIMTSSNFSIGVNMFYKIVEEAVKIMQPFTEYDISTWEMHHNQKVDSPSGTAIEIAKSKKSSYKAVKKYFSKGQEFKQPDFAVLDKFFNAEDDCEAKLKELYVDMKTAKKVKDKAKVLELKADIKKTNSDRKDARKFSKEEMDKHAYFNRAAKVYLDAEKLIKQKDNYSHFEEIEKMYDEAKSRI